MNFDPCQEIAVERTAGVRDGRVYEWETAHS